MRDLKHSLSEDHLVLLPPPLQDDVAEVREVDEAVPGDGVAEVHDVLLHGVQTQHLHGTQQVLDKVLTGNGITQCIYFLRLIFFGLLSESLLFVKLCTFFYLSFQGI